MLWLRLLLSALRTCCSSDCCCRMVSRIYINVETRRQRQTLCFFAFIFTPQEHFSGVTLRGLALAVSSRANASLQRSVHAVAPIAVVSAPYMLWLRLLLPALCTCCGSGCCCRMVSRIYINVETRRQRQTLCFFALTITPLELFLWLSLRGFPPAFSSLGASRV